jgi:hypothetical protein
MLLKKKSPRSAERKNRCIEVIYDAIIICKDNAILWYLQVSETFFEII